MTDEEVFDFAEAVAALSTCVRRQVAAVLVDRQGAVRAVGFNQEHPTYLSCAVSCPRGRCSYDEVPAGSDYANGAGSCIAIHAEMMAAGKFNGRSIEGWTMYVTHQPCHDCQEALDALKVTAKWKEPLYGSDGTGHGHDSPSGAHGGFPERS